MYKLLPFLSLLGCLKLPAQELYQWKNDRPRWATFENPQAKPGAGGMENNSAKGHAFEPIEAGAGVTLLDVQGAGMVQRIWLTVSDPSPEMLRALRIDMYWDGEERPAVSAPLGDFFSISHGRIMPFENALFFRQNLRATIQVLGGYMRDDVRTMVAAGAALIPVTINVPAGCIKLLEGKHPALQDADFPNGWVNFYRSEDYCSTAYFYLDKASNNLPPLAPVALRIAKMSKP